MDILDAWSIKIASEVAPDEMDLAPAMSRAFVKGGDARDSLYRNKSKNTLGGFVPGDLAIALFPCLLKGLAAATPFLMAILSASSNVNDLISVVKDLVDLKNSLKKRKDVPAAADNPYAALKRAMDVISNELQKNSLSQDQSDLIVSRVIKVLLEDPSGATQFLQTVGSAHA
jgi:hypothetical protein